MPLGKVIFVVFLALPLAEFGVFLLVAAAIGGLNAFFALLATSALGVFVLSRASRELLKRVALAAAEQNPALIEAGPQGVLTVLGGLLLALPGFITDAVGLALLVPPVQRRIAVTFTKRRKTDIVDLEDEEWRRVPEKRLTGDEPHRR